MGWRLRIPSNVQADLLKIYPKYLYGLEYGLSKDFFNQYSLIHKNATSVLYYKVYCSKIRRLPIN